MLRIVTDGAVDMPEGWESEYDIRIIKNSISVLRRLAIRSSQFT